MSKSAFASLILLATAGPALAQPAEVSRILRTFDFEERRLGNVEDLPMNWSKIEGSGMPHYVNGHLATDQARSGKYSFRFDLNGGSLVYRYDAGRIKVQAGAHYRVQGYVRTTPLPHARARILAYFVDVDGHALPEFMKSSELYAARSQGEDWRQLSAELTASSPAAAWLVIELALLQPEVYGGNSRSSGTLFAQDIHGSAWFDDVSVAQVPKVGISTSRPGNIFRRGDPVRLQVLVSDRFTDDLAIQIVVHDAQGRKIHQHSGAMDVGAGELLGPGRRRLSVLLPELSPGWYDVSLVIASRGQHVGDEHLHLIQLADNGGIFPPDERFGVIATDLPFQGWPNLPDILPLLGAGRVKLGIWNSSGDIEQVDAAAFDQMLVQLGELHITPTACLLDLPPAIAQKIAPKSTTRDSAALSKGAPPARVSSAWPQLLKAKSEDWRPQLAQLLARHANHLDRWQLGADGTDAFVTVPGMREVYARVYAEFASLMYKPDLAMPWPAWYELEGQLPVTVALFVPPSVLPQQLPLYIADLKDSGTDSTSASPQATSEPTSRQSTRPATQPMSPVRPQTPPNLSITLQPLDQAQYGREVQIRDFAQRIVYALAAGARRIDVPLPFVVSTGAAGGPMDSQPQEMFLVLRTLLTTLGGASFKGKVPIAPGIEAFLFDRSGQGVLVMWDRSGGSSSQGAGGAANNTSETSSSASPAHLVTAGTEANVKPVALNLGRRPLRVDLWGNVSPLLASENDLQSGTTSVCIGGMPIVLVDIDAQAAQLRASVAIDRPLIESSFQTHVRKLRFSNPYATAISGSVKLKGPQGWVINPPSHSFSLNPGEVCERDISIEFPYNTSSGAKTLEAQFAVQADRNISFSVPLAMKLGLSDVGMQTLALRDGGDIVVQQVIQNYGERPVDYTAFAIMPGQSRQERLVTNLAAGKTTIKRYRFTAAAADSTAVPTKIRVGIKELSGPRILNDEVEVQ